MKPSNAEPIALAEVDTAICHQLVKILKLKRQFIDHELKNLQLSRTQWQVLLSQNILGPCSQKELLNQLDIDAAHLTRVLASLEEKQLIERTAVQGDKRALSIHLTDYCKTHIITQIEKTLHKQHEMLFAGISCAEKHQLMRSLNQLITNLDALFAKEDV